MTDESEPLPPPQPARIRAILSELDKVADEYREAKAEFDGANVRLETARERFAAVRRIATELLSDADWANWRYGHEGVRYLGLTIGQAIVSALRFTTYLRAFNVKSKAEKRFTCNLSLEQIQNALEAGGFEFRGPTPKREINAALLKLEGVEKLGEDEYRIEGAYEILESVVGKETAQVVWTDARSDDDVPF